MDLARKEMGEDALLVNARPATPETRHLGAYEVVFGLVPGTAVLAPPAQIAPKSDGNQSLSRDLADLRRQIERLTMSFEPPPLSPALLPAALELMPLRTPRFEQLLSEELDVELVERVVAGANLNQLFRTDASIGSPAIIALVGPPGAGKTTTLIKLAARYGLASRTPVQILTTDVFRIAASEQLRSLAAILGIGCDVAETPLALAQLLDQHRSKELLFIDTPGLGSRDMNDGADLARLLASRPEIDTHLVLPASMKAADMARVIDQYGIFQPSKLLFTRLDETAHYGALVSMAAQRNLPISFLSNGQQIPEDLEEATNERLSELVLGRPEHFHLISKGVAA